MPVHIGTSGWHYEDWGRAFYPDDVAKRRWLEYYSARFQTVESNAAFYRLPKRETFEGWAAGTPDDFVMAVKMSRYLTHIKRLADPGEFICHFHRDHENPSMYLRMDEDTGRVAAVHWPGSGLDAHTIVHAPSPQHGYQAEYLGNAAEAVGHQVAMEEYLPTGVKPDLLISGPRAVMSAGVQRSRISVPTAKRRTTQALLVGATPTWFTDTRANPKWLGQVPGVRINPEIPWDTVPRPRTVSVAGVRHMGWGTIARDRGLSNWAGDPRRPRGSRQTVQGGLAMRKRFVTAALLAALTLALAACGGGNDNGGSGTAATAAPATTAAQAATGTTVAVASSSLGDILVDAEGRTLYAFTKDKGDQSACSGQCADNWPALKGTATAGTGVQASLLSSSMQANGDAQVTYGGRPLYYFAGDNKPGDVNGQGVGNVWYAVTAQGELARQKASGGAYP